MGDNAAVVWKSKRRIILNEVLQRPISEGDPLPIFANRVSSKKRPDLRELDDFSQDNALIDDFLVVCKGINTPNIQCEIEESGRFTWHINKTACQRLLNKFKECLECVALYYEIMNICSKLRSEKTAGPMVYTVCAVIEKNLRKRLFPELLDVDPGSIRTTTRELVGKLRPLRTIVDDIDKNGYVGGPLLTYMLDRTDGSNEFVRGVLQEIRSLLLRRYYNILFEWLTECTLTSDLAHEFFIWDLSRVKSVQRMEFTKADITAFDERFVVIPDLCPYLLTPVRDEIVRIGKYFCTLQSQKSVQSRQLYCRNIREEDYKDKSPTEVRNMVRETCKEISTHILNHFVERFNVHILVLRMPSYFLGMHSGWVQDLARLASAEPFTEPVTSVEEAERKFAALYHRAIDRSNMRNDEFRSMICVKLSQTAEGLLSGNDVAVDEPVSLLPADAIDLHLVGDQSLNLVFPERIILPYRKLFRLSFMLHRAIQLLHGRRFCSDLDETEEEASESTAGLREKFGTILVFQQFLNVYQAFVFTTILRNEWSNFLSKVQEVSDLDELVAQQTAFLSAVFYRGCLDTPTREGVPLSHFFTDLIQHIIDYGSGQTSLALARVQVADAVTKLLRVMPAADTEELSVLRGRIIQVFNYRTFDDAYEEESVNGD